MTIMFARLIAFVLILSATPAQAQMIKNHAKPLDSKVSMTKAEFEALSQTVSETPLSDKTLAFEFRLPKSWTRLHAESEEKTGVAGKLLGDLARYASPPSPDVYSVFRVRAVQLDYMMSLENWMYNYILSSGYTITGIRTSSPSRIEAEYIIQIKGAAHTVRAVAEISGNNIVLAELTVPNQNWETERNQTIWIMAGFHLTTPSKAVVEKLEKFSFLDISKFNFPKSWILNAPSVRSIERIDTAVINMRGRGDMTIIQGGQDSIVLDGKIDISMVAKSLGTTMTEEVSAVKTELAQKNIHFGPLIQSLSDWTFNPIVVKSWVDVYQSQNKDGKANGYEIWVAILETSEHYYFIRLVTPGRDDNFYIWARNTKAFQIVAETLGPDVDETDQQ